MKAILILLLLQVLLTILAHSIVFADERKTVTIVITEPLIIEVRK